MLLQDNELRGKLRLRAVEINDLEQMMKWENDTSLWEFSDTAAPFSSHTIQEFIDNSSKTIFQTSQLRLIIEVDERSIGAIDLFDFNPLHMRAGVGVLIYEPQLRGCGYGRRALSLMADYAFNHLGIHQLYADVPLTNRASLQLFRSSGFSEAGIRKAWLRGTGGRWCDVAFMQLIAKV